FIEIDGACNRPSVHIGKGARPGPARITTGATGFRRRCGGGASLGADGKHRKLRRQLAAVALGTLCLLLPIYKRFKLVIAVLADVLENRHRWHSSGGSLRRQNHLKSYPFKIKRWRLCK